MASGSGEGGSVPLDIAVGVHASNFFDFCNGDMQTYYMYMALMKYDLFASAVSRMKEEHSHDSQVGAGKRRTSGVMSRGDTNTRKDSKQGGPFDPSAPIVIAQSEDQKAESHAKRRLTEAQANEAEMKAKSTALDFEMKSKTAANELTSRLIAQYETAQEKLSKYTGEDVYLRCVLTAHVEMAKKNLGEVVTIGS